MGWRKTGSFRPPEEVRVMTCDVCESDIGHRDGRRPQEHFLLSRHPNAGHIDAQEPPIALCSADCLRAFAAGVVGPLRTPPAADNDELHPEPK